MHSFIDSMATIDGHATSNGGVLSVLDTDLYKLTMQCGVLKYFPDAKVSYKFTNRTPRMQLSQNAFAWLKEQVENLTNVVVTEKEVEWLTKTCPYLSREYLDYLRLFRFRPSEHISLSFDPEDGSVDSGDQPGRVEISVSGLWIETILYEIPLLALVSEAYFKFVDKDWNHDDQEANANAKAAKLLEAGCAFSEFGSRRRRDYKTHELVMQGILAAQKEADANGWSGKFAGTSNVHLAMKYGMMPVGTVAHEWFMGIAALTEDYAGANENALQHWVGAFGRGVLSIALTDTFGTPSFLQAFSRPAPKGQTTDTEVCGKDSTYAELFAGTRQDSGNPLEFVKTMRAYYDKEGINQAKSIVFSDSLNVDKCIKYKHATEVVGLTASFGVGTFFTNDFRNLSDGQKSVPLNIVIKLSEANGVPAVKLSDDLGKNMGPEEMVKKVKSQIGYINKSWKEADEAHRWD